MRRVGIIAAFALALGGCAVTSSAVQVDSIKAIDVANTAYVAVGSAYLAVESTLPPATKATIKADLAKVINCTGAPGAYVCTGYLQAARNAAKIGDQTTLAAQLTLATQVLAEINGLIHPPPVAASDPIGDLIPVST